MGKIHRQKLGILSGDQERGVEPKIYDKVLP